MAVAEQQMEAEEQPQGRGLETYKRWWRSAEEQHSKARKHAHRDRDWYDNYDNSQWDETEKAVLEKRSQPIVSSNRIKRKVNFMCGVEQKSRSDPMAQPRSPQHQEAANVATKVLTFIEDNTRFDRISSRCFKDFYIEGIGVCEVIVEEKPQSASKADLMGSTMMTEPQPEYEIVINKIDYDQFFYDPRSSEEDFSDARYVGYQEWFDEEDAKEMFPEKEAEIAGSMSDNVLDEGYEDKPGMHWGDSQRKRVRIACMYWRDGKDVWHYVYFTGGGVLDEGVSPYEEEGQPACPIIAESAYVTRDNERYGGVRDMISPQREMNYRRSMALFLLKNRRMWSAPGVFNDNEQNTKEEVARADGHIRANGAKDVDWGFIDSSQEIQGNFELLQEAKSEIETQGPNSGLQGRGTEDQSGKAIALQQNAGLAEENTLFDTHNDWKLRVYRAMWWRAKQYWTEERAIRVTDDQNATQFIMVNQPSLQMDPQTGMPVQGAENALAEMDVDIVLELGPDMITLQHEEFAQLGELAKAGIPVPPDVLLEASQLRNKRELIDRLKQEMSAQSKLQQAEQMIQQLQKQLQQAQQASMQKPATPMDMAKIQDMERAAARADATAQADIQVKGADARAKEANTAKTVKEILTPAPPVQPGQ